MAEIKFLEEKINNGNNEIFRNLYGNDPSVLREQALAFIDLMKLYESVFQSDDVELFSSPGRTEIGGNHTDHNMGRVLAGSVSLDNIAVAAANNTGIIRIESAGYPAIEVDTANLDPVDQEKFTSASLVRGVVAGLKNAGYRYGGFNACINGRVPKGSGLSSSASFEVLIGSIISKLFNNNRLDPVTNAIIGQYAENNFFGKPCGLMDQTACAVGGLITIDFKDPSEPIVRKVGFDFTKTGYSLVITDTGGNHANLNDDYASLPMEMKSVASVLRAKVLREVTMEDILGVLPEIRTLAGDRAILRAYHFQGDNERVVRQVDALEKGDFQAFLNMVVESGYSSFMYNQNIYSPQNTKEQGVALGLAMSEMVLKGKGAWRVHGGGFAGTIQAFVPESLVNKYVETMNQIFGSESCHILFIREQGAVNLDMISAK
ncbi:MAG: galactokinase [Bacteroidales bacterium]